MKFSLLWISLRYARAKGIDPDEAAGLFSSIFSSFYLGLEVTLKVVGSLVSTYVGGDSEFGT